MEHKVPWMPYEGESGAYYAETIWDANLREEKRYAPSLAKVLREVGQSVLPGNKPRVTINLETI